MSDSEYTEELNSQTNYAIDPFIPTIGFIIFAIFIYMKYRTRNPVNENGIQIGNLTRKSNYPVKGILNPFYIDVDLKRSTLNDGIYFKIKTNSQFKSKFHCLIVWSIKINEFYTEFEKPLVENIYNESYLEDISLKRTKIDVLQDESSESGLDSDYYYATPQTCKEEHERQYNQITNTYPVMVVLYRQKSDLEELNETDIVATFNIIHLKDKNMESKTLYTYSKCLNDRTISMHKLYTQDSEFCVVCLTAKSEQVFLPCKHYCVCSSCLNHLNSTCPLCRQTIYHSFKVN